jgi:hypothetical protein
MAWPSTLVRGSESKQLNLNGSSSKVALQSSFNLLYAICNVAIFNHFQQSILYARIPNDDDTSFKDAVIVKSAALAVMKPRMGLSLSKDGAFPVSEALVGHMERARFQIDAYRHTPNCTNHTAAKNEGWHSIVCAAYLS